MSMFFFGLGQLTSHETATGTLQIIYSCTENRVTPLTALMQKSSHSSWAVPSRNKRVKAFFMFVFGKISDDQKQKKLTYVYGVKFSFMEQNELF